MDNVGREVLLGVAIVLQLVLGVIAQRVLDALREVLGVLGYFCVELVDGHLATLGEFDVLFVLAMHVHLLTDTAEHELALLVVGHVLILDEDLLHHLLDIFVDLEEQILRVVRCRLRWVARVSIRFSARHRLG